MVLIMCINQNTSGKNIKIMNDKYGVDNYFQRSDLMEQHWLNTIGCRNPQQDKDINKKIYKGITMKLDINDYEMVHVESVTDAKREHVYDIEVDSDDHAFIATSSSGAVGISHNSALISLSNLSDDRVRHAKSGRWWDHAQHRALANNTAVYTEKPDVGIFMDEWKSLYDSKSGERGIFNRESAKKQSIKYGRRDPEHEMGVNPCGEILLRPMEFCNLTEVVVRHDDTKETLIEKVKQATILGTIQSTLTNFKYIRKHWKDNVEEERLLGVSMTGVMDCKLTNDTIKNPEKVATLLRELREVAIETNKIWAKKIGIPQSVMITTQKPSGTVSQKVDSSSGIHTRHNDYYIRRVRGNNNDPLTKMMTANGFPNEPDVTQPNTTTVFSFPIKAPENSITRKDVTAIDQLNAWKIYKENWTEHNPSCTISVKEHEWMTVGAWVYDNFDEIGGLSFLPYSDSNYRQMPYEDCSKEEYEQLVSEMPTEIDWAELSEYEKIDHTKGSQTAACTAGVCEIVDI